MRRAGRKVQTVPVKAELLGQEPKKRGRPPKRFLVKSEAPSGRVTQRSVDTVVEAWDWYAYYTATAPLNEVTIVDREQDIEARA